MSEYLELGSVPCDEECVQVDKNDYLEAMRKECQRYKAMLQNRFYFAADMFRIKGFPHDFGTYYEVCISFNENTEDIAFFVEDNLPASWNDQEIFESMT